MGHMCRTCRGAWRLGRRKGEVCGLIREALEEDGQAVPAPGVYELIEVQGVGRAELWWTQVYRISGWRWQEAGLDERLTRIAEVVGSNPIWATSLPWRRANRSASIGRYLARDRRPNPSRPGYYGMLALAQVGLSHGVGGNASWCHSIDRMASGEFDAQTVNLYWPGCDIANSAWLSGPRPSLKVTMPLRASKHTITSAPPGTKPS